MVVRRLFATPSHRDFFGERDDAVAQRPRVFRDLLAGAVAFLLLSVRTPAHAQDVGAGATVPAPLEVSVRGPSAADRLRQSAQAVKVIETKEAQQQAADMGEVLARTEGVGVQRGGGLGSS